MTALTAWILDDDEFILRALHRMLKRLYPEWQLLFFSDPMALLSQLQAVDKPDLVICDRVMPEVSGEEILAQVRFLAPNAVRVLLTADTEAGVVIDDCCDIHHFLAKPFTEADFQLLFQSTANLVRLPLSVHCRQELGSLNHLPVLPAVFRELQQLIRLEQTDSQGVAVLVAKDAVLTGKILQLANSPFIGFSRKTTSLDEAISRLGFSLVESIAVSLYSEQAFDGKITAAIHQQVMQQGHHHAGLVRQLAKAAKMSLAVQDLVFMAMLLRSLGVLTLMVQGRTLAEAWTEQEFQQPYPDYLLLSCYILTLWGFEQQLCLLMLTIGTPEQQLQFSQEPLDQQSDQANSILRLLPVLTGELTAPADLPPELALALEHCRQQVSALTQAVPASSC